MAFGKIRALREMGKHGVGKTEKEVKTWAEGATFQELNNRFQLLEKIFGVEAVALMLEAAEGNERIAKVQEKKDQWSQKVKDDWNESVRFSQIGEGRLFELGSELQELIEGAKTSSPDDKNMNHKKIIKILNIFVNSNNSELIPVGLREWFEAHRHFYSDYNRHITVCENNYSKLYGTSGDRGVYKPSNPDLHFKLRCILADIEIHRERLRHTILNGEPSFPTEVEDYMPDPDPLIKYTYRGELPNEGMVLPNEHNTLTYAEWRRQYISKNYDIPIDRVPDPGYFPDPPEDYFHD